MPRVRRRADIHERWQRRAAQASQDYLAGVRDPRADWAQATQAAEQNWQQAVAQAAQERRFGRGVARAGTQKWQRGVELKGERRYSEGVQVAADAYAQGVAPYLETIERTQLPPRAPKGDPRNIQRVAAIASALHEVKRRQLGGGGR